MNLARPLLVSTDTDLIDECSRLAAIAGVELHVLSHANGDLSRWAHAPLVLIDCTSASAAVDLPRRAGVVVVTRGSSDSIDPIAWRMAVGIGAEQVTCLPDAETWLIERLSASIDEPSRDGRLVAFLPATGGAGASTLAAACVSHSAEQGRPSLLIDGDRLGGGIDLVLGGEEATGIRWPELVDTRGRLATSSFRQALPTMGGASVLSWDREGSPDVSTDAWNSVLDVGKRGFDLTVVDLPRQFGAQTAHVLSRAHAVVLVVSARVRGAVAAARVMEELAALTSDIRVIVRERQGGVRAESIGRILGVPILGTIPTGAPLADDGQLPRFPESVIRACLDQPVTVPVIAAA